MFGMFKKPNCRVKVMGMNAEILEILHSGRPIMKSPTLENMAKDRLEGSVFEIGIFLNSGDPYFVYYVSEDYYLEVSQLKGLAQNIGKCEQFRNMMSQVAAKFLVQFLLKRDIDITMNLSTFSHNRKHTHVLAYIRFLGDWYPLRHGEHESDMLLTARYRC